MMKIYTVTFNDGGWHTSRPEYQVVSETKEEAIQIIYQDKIIVPLDEDSSIASNRNKNCK